jgi:uncharacterized protein YhdP
LLSISFRLLRILLYADDILLLALYVTELQLLLSTCERHQTNIGMNINVHIDPPVQTTIDMFWMARQRV